MGPQDEDVTVGFQGEHGRITGAELEPDSLQIKETNASSILCGYARVARHADGTLSVESQLHAFRAALLFARDIQERTGHLPPISIGIDHKGTFRKQFLADNLSNKQRRYPVLANLHVDIVSIYQNIAMAVGVSLDAITVLPEDSARSRITNTLLKLEIPESQLRGLITFVSSGDVSDALDSPLVCTLPESEVELGAEDRPRATCAALVVEDFRRSTENGQQPMHSSTLEVFYEERAWSPSELFVKAIQYSHRLGFEFSVRLHLVDATGRTVSGAFSKPYPAMSSVADAL